MGKILCFFYQGMAEFEVTFAFHRLKNVGQKEIVTISYNREPLQSQSGFIYLPQATVTEALTFEDVDALIIPGGPITAQQPELTALIQKLDQEEKLLAAICNGPQFLGRAGILDHHRFTTSCSEEQIRTIGAKDPFPRQNFIKQRVVTDANVITATGRAFVDFAFAVFDRLSIFENKTDLAQLLEDVKGN